MAIDGLKILESDFAIDIQNEIFDLYDQNKSEKEIAEFIKTEKLKIENSLDYEIFITSSCLTLWEIGQLQSENISDLKDLIAKGADKFWLDNFDKQTLDKRNTEIQKLLEKISIIKTKKRTKRKYSIIENKIFVKGDVLSVNFGNTFGCLIFEHFYQNKEDAYYCFVPTNYRQNTEPKIDDLLIAEIPITKTKDGKIGIRKLEIYYDTIETLKKYFLKIGTLHIDSEQECLGFGRQVSIESIDNLKQEIDDILEGYKTEIYNSYTI